MKKVIWAFFDGLNGSFRKAMDPEKYIVISMDILTHAKDGYKNTIMDMTRPIEEIINDLDKLPKADIMIFHPMCQSFSGARRMEGGVEGYIKDDNILRERERESFDKCNLTSKRAPSNWEGVINRRTIGQKAIQNTWNVIQHYKPKKWFIENPRTSLIWFYMEKNMQVNISELFMNNTEYGAYGHDSKKPTSFLSNVKMELKKTPKGWKGTKGSDQKSYKDRSDIPSGVLQHIMQHFEK